MEAYINGALRKELHMAPVIERFEAATLEGLTDEFRQYLKEFT